MATQAYIPQYDAYPYHLNQQDPPSPTLTITMPGPPDAAAPRFSKLLTSVLGSPFLTTSDLPHHNRETSSLRSISMHSYTRTRSNSNGDSEETIDGTLFTVPRDETVTRPTSPSPSFRTETYSIVNWNDHKDLWANEVGHAGPSTLENAPTGCGIGLRSSIWSSASATYFPYYTSTPYSTIRFNSHSNQHSHSNSNSSPTSPSTSMKASRSLGLLPKLWDALRETSSPMKSFKGKRRLGMEGGYESSIWNEVDMDGNINVDYANLEPLDGEEGELIDDEACFIDVRAVTGLDIIALVPEEVSLLILAFLDLHDILSCLGVSRIWRRLAFDNSIWRSLFKRRIVDGWGVDLRRLKALTSPRPLPPLPPVPPIPSIPSINSCDMDASPSPITRTKSYPYAHSSYPFALSRAASTSTRYTAKGTPYLKVSTSFGKIKSGNEKRKGELDWFEMYRTRAQLEDRWGAKPSRKSAVSPGGSGTSVEGGAFEPRVKWITGHTDSVYCLEFDSTRIITGSRDRTIKVWSLKTGRCLATFKGHSGSVLCLKFDKDWDLDPANSLFGFDDQSENYLYSSTSSAYSHSNSYSYSRKSSMSSRHRRSSSGRRARKSLYREWRKGFMVSGSSDCTICVWDLFASPVEMDAEGLSEDGDSGNEGDNEGRTVTEMAVVSEMRGILTGHTGGVLDIRIDEKWIVSCSKDATIRVWDRKTLEHRVVSASGDGKMMLWDIGNGERLRTFEGHDRGLACIEFKVKYLVHSMSQEMNLRLSSHQDDTIVSGSNDCKMKVWSASTGECLRTLVGHDMLVRALSFDSKSGRLVSGSYDRTVKVWDINTGKMVREFKGGHVSHIFDVKFDGRRIVSTSHDQKIVVLDFTEGLDASLFT
ncbi:hypothetical protein NLI96_g6274 [Meripilus lineatus]|uniref:F-box domain-containing protein n=1 Tax=Meripilus lineatus TaxID=2056292 RepID=A0AAD5YD52_9APHY|nr:hypothetical protein NLI96_g6274 [Physisporinus lineatus]